MSDRLLTALLLVLSAVLVGLGLSSETRRSTAGHGRTVLSAAAGGGALFFGVTVVVEFLTPLSLVRSGDQTYALLVATTDLGALCGALVAQYGLLERWVERRWSVAEESFHELFDSVSEGLLVHDAETGAIVDANQGAERLFGYSVDELREMDVEDFSADDDAFDQQRAVRAIREAAVDGERRVDWSVVRADGRLIWVDVVLSAATIDGRECVLALVRDVTGRTLRAERIGVLSRVVRHDLRNRLTVISGNAGIIRSRGDEEVAAMAASIEEAAHELEQLGEHAHTVRKLSGHDWDDRDTPVDVLVREATTSVAGRHPDATVTVHLPDRVDAESGSALSAAVEHLTENGVEHTPDDAPEVRVTLTVDADVVEVVVEDEGPGLPVSERELITDSRERTQLEHSSGMGLWIARWAVAELGGELRFDVDDDGTTATVRVPRVDAPRAPGGGLNDVT